MHEEFIIEQAMTFLETFNPVHGVKFLKKTKKPGAIAEPSSAETKQHTG